MVKCVVSGCPNRMVSVTRGVLNRPRKRFYNFPKDPTRVKVWLAALRETDQQDSSDQRLICEDHFLPEDISANGINRDAIPIMPPYLDGTLGRVNPWGDESSEEEEQEDEEEEEEVEEQKEEEEEDESGDDAPPALDPPQQNPGGGVENPPELERTSASLPQRKQSDPSQRDCRQDVSLGLLTLRFLKLLLAAPDGALDLRDVVANLQTHRRRVYDITHVLNSLNLLQKKSPNWVKWIGKIPISSFLWKTQQQFQREMENLKLVEDQLDGLIRSCSRQLFDMTDDAGNSKSAYVTHEDVRRLPSVQQQTVIIVKAPEETKLEIPAPQEDNIQIHLKAEKGPIVVLTCEMGSADAVTSDPGCFLTLEESRVRSTTLHTAT